MEGKQDQRQKPALSCGLWIPFLSSLPSCATLMKQLREESQKLSAQQVGDPLPKCNSAGHGATAESIQRQGDLGQSRLIWGSLHI